MDDDWSDLLAEALELARENSPVAEDDWREHAWTRVRGVRTPSLARIPREHWREFLITCNQTARNYAVFDHYLTPEQRGDARALVAELPPPPSEGVRNATRTAPRVGFGHRIARPPISRQLNLRLATEDYDALAAAARLLGSKPTQVARMLINAGVHRLLADYDVTMDDARGQQVPSDG
jgi:hypothetical protein